MEQKEQILLTLYRELVGNQNMTIDDEIEQLLEDLEQQQEREHRLLRDVIRITKGE